MNHKDHFRQRGQPHLSDRELSFFKKLKVTAPAGFSQRVNATLATRKPAAINWWPAGWAWMTPALTGAVAGIIIMAILLPTPEPPPETEQVMVNFEVHAPGAARVELVGDFTAWQPGLITLQGPDESGHWKTDLQLPEGRYEYLFLVDGTDWVTDIFAPTHRQDGFGNLNAIINL